VNRVGAFALPFMTLWLTRQVAASTPQAGWVVAGFGLASMVSRLVGGRLADRWGHRPTMLLGLTCCAVALLAMAAADTLAQAAGAVVLLGLSFEIYESPCQALIADSLAPERRPVAFGALGAALSAAALVAGLLAALLAPHSLRLLFVADAATCLAAALVVLRLVPAATAPPRSAAPVGSRPQIWRDPALLVLFAVNVVFAVCYLQVFISLPLTLRSRGIGAGGVGLLMTVSAATVILGQPLLRRSRGPLAGPRTAVPTGLALAAAGFAGYGVAGGPATFLGATVVLGLGDVLLMGHLVALVSRIAPAGHHATYLAGYGLSWGVAATLGPLTGTWLLDHGGSRTLWLWAAGCCAVLAGSAPAMWRRLDSAMRLAKPRAATTVDRA
jgi:MFS family permease